MSLKSFLAISIALVALAWPGARALADEDTLTAECARAYEQGQVLRQSGELVAARATLRSCARDECPDFIHTDCANWYEEVQSELPTLVFAARSRGRDLSEVRISVGDRLLASHIDGQVVELDPGEYDFRFEAADQRLLQQRFVIARGERNRLIQVELEPAESAAGDRPPRPPWQGPDARRSLLLPAILAGVGTAGLAGFAGLGLWGRAGEKQLETSCAPGCSDARVAEVRTRYLLADVSLGVGVASLALGAYLVLSQDSQPHARRYAPNVAVTAAPGAAGVTYEGAF